MRYIRELLRAPLRRLFLRRFPRAKPALVWKSSPPVSIAHACKAGVVVGVSACLLGRPRARKSATHTHVAVIMRCACECVLVVLFVISWKKSQKHGRNILSAASQKACADLAIESFVYSTN